MREPETARFHALCAYWRTAARACGLCRVYYSFHVIEREAGRTYAEPAPLCTEDCRARVRACWAGRPRRQVVLRVMPVVVVAIEVRP